MLTSASAAADMVMMADELCQFLQGGLLLIDHNRLSEVQTLLSALQGTLLGWSFVHGEPTRAP